MIKWLFNNKAQIGYNKSMKTSWGYHNLYKEGYGLEDDRYTKYFGIGHAWICWCPGDKYRIKYLKGE
jgi:hypothetical protein